MSSILAVGIATLDIVNTLASYPREDEEVRALAQSRVRGGNATNTLVILSQLGHHCSWAGVLPREPDSQVVLDDLDRYRVDITAVQRPVSGKLPTSYISLSAETGSRTIVHYRDLPEYDFDVFDALDLSRYDWLHFEGRNIGELGSMLEKARQAGVPCSLEAEKPREGIENLFDLPDVLLFSRAYVRQKGFQACLRPRDRFWDIPGPKIDSAFDNLFVPQPSWSPSTTQQLRKLVVALYLAPI